LIRFCSFVAPNFTAANSIAFRKPLDDVQCSKAININAIRTTKNFTKDNHLPFIKLDLLPTKDSDVTIPIDAMLDCGSTHTLICYSVIARSKHQHLFNIRPMTQEVTILGALQDYNCQALSDAYVYLNFTDKSGKTTRLKHHVFFVSGLSHVAFLGNDFLLSDHHVLTTSTTLVISPEGTPKCDNIPSLDPEWMYIPIHQRFFQPGHTLLATTMQTIAANKTALIHVTKPRIQAREFYTENFEEGTNLEPTPMIHHVTSHKDSSEMAIPVYCNSHEDLTIEKGTPIAIAIPMTDDPSDTTKIRFTTSISTDLEEANPTIQQFTIDRPDNKNNKNIYINHVHIDTIEDKSPLNQRNTEEAAYRQKSLDKFGFYQQPITDLINEIDAKAEIDVSPDAAISKTDDELIDSMEISHLTTAQQEKAKKMVRRNLDIFSRHSTDIGITNMIEAYATVRPGMSPADYQPKYIPPPLHLRKQIQQIIKHLLAAGVLVYADSPVECVSNILVRIKPNGSIRLLLDARCSNYFTRRLAAAATMSLDEILQYIVGRSTSLIDISQSYFQIPMRPDSWQYFSFLDPEKRLLSFTRAVQGHHNSSRFLCQAVRKMLDTDPYATPRDQPIISEQQTKQIGSTDDNPPPASFAVTDHPLEQTTLLPPHDLPSPEDPIAIFHIWDDLGVSSEPQDDFDAHLDAVQLLFDKCRAAKFKLRLEKLQLCPPTLKLLGYEYKKNCLHIPSQRLAALRKLRTDTPKTVKAFVASCSYYRSFVPSFSNLVKPLIEASIQDKATFRFLPEHEEAKQKLLKALDDNQKRHLYTAGTPLILSTDASHHCMASTLEAVIDGRPQLIASFSRTFNPSEFKHNCFFKEAHTLLASLQHFAYYLAGAPEVKVITDVRAILYLRLTSSNNTVAFRLSSEISKYDFQICHANTSLHHKVDSLTRQNAEQDELEDNLDINRTLTADEALALVNRVVYEHGQVFTAEEARRILSGQSAPSLIKSKKAKKVDKLKPPGTYPKGRPEKRIAKPNFKQKSKATEEGRWKKARNQSQPRQPRQRIAAHNVWLDTRPARSSSCPPQIEETRAPRTDTQRTDAEEPMEDDEHPITLDGTEPITLIQVGTRCISTGQVPLDIFIRLQRQDSFCAEKIEELDNLPQGEAPTGDLSNYLIEKGLLLYKHHRDEQNQSLRICLPLSLLPALCHLLHFTTTGTHRNCHELYRVIAKDYYRPSLERKCKEAIAGCAICSHAYKGNKRRHTFSTQLYTTIPRTAWYADILDLGTDTIVYTDHTGEHDPSCRSQTASQTSTDELPSSQPRPRGRPPKQCRGECLQNKERIRYIFIACDVASGFITAHPLPSRAERELYKSITSAIITPFQIPHIIVSDGERGLIGEFTQTRLKDLGIQFRTISSGASWGNRAELAIKAMKQRLRPTMITSNTPLEELPIVVAAQNSTPNDHGISPEMLMFSSAIGMPLSLLQIIDRQPRNREETDAVKRIMDTYHEKRNQRATEARKNANKNLKPRQFEPDQLVNVRSERFSGGSSSLKIANLGPYIVIEQVSPSSYTLKNVDTGQIIKRHASSLTPINDPYLTSLLTTNWDQVIQDILTRHRVATGMGPEHEPETDPAEETDQQPQPHGTDDSQI